MKKILIINGHPNKESFNAALAAAYKAGALAAGAELQEIAVGELPFELSLRFGYQKKLELEPCLIDAQEKIKWADHIVWVFPVWWGGMPAILKGFIDRIFLSGFAYKYEEGSKMPKKLLTGRSARVIMTMGATVWHYRFAYRQPATNEIKRVVLDFCGIKPVGITYFGSVDSSTPEKRAIWLKEVERLGTRME